MYNFLLDFGVKNATSLYLNVKEKYIFWQNLEK